MKITQPDSRTVRIQSDDGVTFHLPYRFHWNGHDREPVSVVLETSTTGGRPSCDVKAFFLFGMVNDHITSDAWGISIARSWKAETPGPVRLLMDVDFQSTAEPSFMFPGVHAGQGFPTSPISFRGEKTSYPAAVIVGLEEHAVLVFSRSPVLEGEMSSVGILRMTPEDEPERLRVEIRFPGAEEPGSRIGPRPQDMEDPDDPVFDSSGTLERSHELFLAFAPRERIFAPAAVLGRLRPQMLPKVRGPSSMDLEALGNAARQLLETHLVRENGIAGLRETVDSPWISSMAGAAMAVALGRLFPRDEQMRETALELADFCLKGQLASGMFFESFLLEPGTWRGVKGRADRTVLSVGYSALIADLLLMLAEDLARSGHPSEKYFLAGQRFVDLFIDEKARLALPEPLFIPGQQLAFGEAEKQDSRVAHAALREASDISGWQLFHPLARVRERTGRDRYKKGLDVIARRFSTVRWDPFHPPCSRSGRSPDSAAALTAVRLFVEMRKLGYKPSEPPAGSAAAARAHSAESVELFASLLVPWVHVQGAERGTVAAERALPLDGTIADGFVRQRLLFAGYETAYLLLSLRKLGGRKELGALLKDVALICLGNAREVPLGTSYFQHTRWNADGKPEKGQGEPGPVDSRRLTGELLSGLLISSEFPRLGQG